jgi:hypothetical protein
MNLLWHIVSAAVVVAGTFALWGTSVRLNNPNAPVAYDEQTDAGAVPRCEGTEFVNNGEISVLFVMDSVSEYCFEEVGIDPYTNTTLLSWVMGLNDALTSTESLPNVEEFMVSENEFRGVQLSA